MGTSVAPDLGWILFIGWVGFEQSSRICFSSPLLFKHECQRSLCQIAQISARKCHHAQGGPPFGYGQADRNQYPRGGCPRIADLLS